MKSVWIWRTVVGSAAVLVLSWLLISPIVAHAQGLTTLQRIMETKSFRFCADQFNLPFSDRNVTTPGVDIEIAELVVKKWGVRATFYWVTTVHRGGMSYAYRNSIEANRCDCFLGVPTGPKWEEEPARHGLVLTNPHFGTGFVLVVRKDDTATRTLEDLRGKKVAVQMVSPADRWLFENGFEIVHYREAKDALQGITAGEADAGFLWEPSTGWAMVTEEGKYDAKIVEGFEMLPKLRINLGMAVRAEDQDFKEKLEASLAELMQNGELAKVYERYGMTYHPPFE